MSVYLRLIHRRPAFRLLWLGELVTQLGDWLSYVAISLLAMSHGPGEGAIALALVLAAHSLPHAALAPIAGPIADRYDRRTLLVLTHLGQATLTLAMLLSIDTLWVLQILLAARTSLSALDWPARTAAVAQVVPAEDLLTANALCTTTWSMTFALGMAGGGALALLGPVPALALDALTFVLAAGLVSLLPSLPAPGKERVDGIAILDALANRKVVRAVFAKTPTAIAGGSALVVLNIISTQSAFAGAAGLTLGLLQTVKGLGTGVGPAWIRGRIRAGSNASVLWGLSILTTFVGILVFIVSSSPAGWLVGSWIWGMGSGSNWVLSTTELQRNAPESHLGRLSAFDAFSMTLGMSCAAITTGILIERTGHLASAAWPGIGMALIFWGILWLSTADWAPVASGRVGGRST